MFLQQQNSHKINQLLSKRKKKIFIQGFDNNY